MIIQGPLRPDWSNRKFGVLPGIENSEVQPSNWGRPKRIDGWVDLHIGVVGRPEWIFIKVHCHGASWADSGPFLGDKADRMFSHLETTYGAGGYRLHYVTLREMYNIVKAAEAGKTGNPHAYRDFVIPPYQYVSSE